MHRPHSACSLRTRKDPCQNETCERTTTAIPGYTGYVPGRSDNFDFSTWRRETQACCSNRSLPTFDAQQLRRERERDLPSRTRCPKYDNRGIGFRPAGDTDSVAMTTNERTSQIAPGNVSQTWDATVNHAPLGRNGSAHDIKGYSSVTRNIPGFTGYIPGKVAENLFGDGFSKTCENSLASHFLARKDQFPHLRPHSAPTGLRSSSRPNTSQRPISAPVITKDHTAVLAVDTDFMKEIPLISSSYQDMIRGWSQCPYNGCQVEPAGAVAPVGRQERFFRPQPPVGDGIPPGYTGYVPGKRSENVFAERKHVTRQISQLLTHKNKVRSKQR